MNRELVLFTTNYPYTHNGGETTFVHPEMPHLVRVFRRVRVVPLYASGPALAVPDGVVVDQGLSAAWSRCRLLYYLSAPWWPGFWPEFIRALRRGGWIGAIRTWRWAALAHAAWTWMKASLPEDREILLYTYWRGGQTLAAVRWAQFRKGCLSVSRVHRYELYEEAFRPPFQPWGSVYFHLTRILPIARHGEDYLKRRGVPEERLILARLGVPRAVKRSNASTDGVLRIVSCSSVTPVKRVEFSVAVLAAFAALHPECKIEWVHFGDGPAMPAVLDALQNRPANLKATFPGHVSNDEVLRHYRTHPVDFFLLLSASEGLPVSIQEALAHGIPVLATDVGGISEAVDADGGNGALVPPNASPGDAAAILERLLLAPPEVRGARRDAALEKWKQDFNAERNHSRLALELARL